MSGSYKSSSNTTSGGKSIRTTDGTTTHTWQFGADGSFTFPDSTVQHTAYVGQSTSGTTGVVDANCPAGVATVIFTASSGSVHTLKITAQAVGFETGVTDFADTHSADIMVVKNLRTGLGEASVYGVTYSSVSPLVIFDAQITGDVLEVTAQPTSSTNSIVVNSVGIEISV